MMQQEKYKIVIVGGVAAGASAAAKARRSNEDAEIIILEKGPHISYATCGLPYYLGDTIRLHYAENTGGFFSLGAALPAGIVMISENSLSTTNLV